MATQEEMALEMAKAAAGSVGKESVNKLAAVLGGFFPFFGLKREAVSTYVADIQKSDLPPEAKMLAIATAKKTYKQLKNQADIARIAQNAAREGTDFSQQSSVDDEWLERFMDSARFVSDEEVQLLWGNVLASEFENPGNTPPSIIRILSELTPKYAKAFQIICSLLVCIIRPPEDELPYSFSNHIILPDEYDYLKEYGVGFSELKELEVLGLIQTSSLGYQWSYDKKPSRLYLVYGKDTATISNYPDNGVPIGTLTLTDAGQTIAKFAERKIIGGHFEAVCANMEGRGITFLESSEVPSLLVKWADDTIYSTWDKNNE